VHLASYHGQVVLLNFWGTWCPPCLAEIPSLVQLHREMPSLAMVAIAVPEDEGIDEDPTAYKAFIARHHIDFTTVRDTKASAPSSSTRYVARDLYHRPPGHHPPQVHWDARLDQPEIQNYLKSL